MNSWYELRTNLGNFYRLTCVKNCLSRLLTNLIKKV